MLLYLLIALVLLFAPHPSRLGKWLFYVYLGLAVVFCLSGMRVMMAFRSDGLLFGGLLITLGAAFVLKAFRSRISESPPG